MTIIYKKGNEELLDIIKPLWEKLNEEHRRLSVHFSDEFLSNTFDKRKAGLLELTKTETIRIDLAKDSATNQYIGYCVSTVNQQKVGEVASLYVEENYRGLGIGHTLMKKSLFWMEHLSVIKKNYRSTWKRKSSRFLQEIQLLSSFLYIRTDGRKMTIIEWRNIEMKTETERLVIVPVTQDNIKEAASQYPIGDHITYHLEECKENPALISWGSWFVIRKEDNRVIGDIGFKGKANHEGAVEIGYGILPEAQNQGYATEAVKAIIHWAFSDTQVKRIIAECDENNYPSIKVLEKVKMNRIKVQDGMIYWELTNPV